MSYSFSSKTATDNILSAAPFSAAFFAANLHMMLSAQGNHASTDHNVAGDVCSATRFKPT